MFLFNLQADPKEQHNVVDQHPGRVAKLLRKLYGWWNPELNGQPDRAANEPITRSLIFRSFEDTDLKMKLWYPPAWQPGGAIRARYTLRRCLPVGLLLLRGQMLQDRLQELQGHVRGQRHGQQQLRDLIAAFSIGPSDLLTTSYADMREAAPPPLRDR